MSFSTCGVQKITHYSSFYDDGYKTTHFNYVKRSKNIYIILPALFPPQVVRLCVDLPWLSEKYRLLPDARTKENDRQ